jgi:hypothetical protein
MNDTDYKMGDNANGHVLTEQGWLPVGAAATSPAPTPKPEKGRKLLAVGGAVMLSLVACSAMLSGTDSGTAAEPTAAPAASAPAEPAKDAETEAEIAPEAEAAPSITRSQENALRAAGNYLDFAAFSRSGLIEQLEFEGYDKADANWAVDELDVDWNEQAAKSAETYLEFSAFSRSGLIDQLEFEGYTTAQATYGADQAGL